MKQHHIDQMASILASSNAPLSQETITSILQHYWSDKYADVWTAHDVLETCYDAYDPETDPSPPALSLDDAAAILKIAGDYYDADEGLNYEAIRHAISIFKSDKRTLGTSHSRSSV